jgi:hypothetical protein
MPADLSNGKTVKGASTPHVYLMENGVRRHIPDPATFNGLGLDWAGVQVISDQELAAIPEGPPMPRAGNQEQIRQYLQQLPELPREPALTVPIDRHLGTTAFDGVPYHFEEQVVKAISEVSDFAVLNPTQDVLWPGALIQGNSLASGQLAPIQLDRAPGTITVATDFAGGGTAQLSRVIDRPEFPTVQQARHDLLTTINPTNSAGALTYDMTVARTMRHAMVKLGLNVNVGKVKVDLDASLDSSYETNTVAMRFNQAYYTVTFTPSGSPPDFFADTVTLSEVEKYATADNPPCYLSSVTYGRMLLVLVTSRASSLEIKAALKAGVGSVFTGSLEGQYKELLSQSSIMVLAVGPTGEATTQVLTDPVAGFQQYLKEGLTFSLASPGAPIAYTARYLNTQTMAKVSLACQYSEHTRVWADNVDRSYEVWDGKGIRRVDTGISVAPGDSITITASGRIWAGVLITNENGPEGWVTYKAKSSFPLPGRPPFSLIAGYDPGSWAGWWVVGSGWNGAYNGPPRDPAPRLLLSLNDDDVGTGAKHFDVRVQVTRKQRNELHGVGSTA